MDFKNLIKKHCTPVQCLKNNKHEQTCKPSSVLHRERQPSI